MLVDMSMVPLIGTVCLFIISRSSCTLPGQLIRELGDKGI